MGCSPTVLQRAWRLGLPVSLAAALAVAGTARADNASAVRRGDIGAGWLEITVRNTAENVPNPGDEAGAIFDFHLDIATKSGRPQVTFTGEHGSYRNGWQPQGDFTGQPRAVFVTSTNPVPQGQSMSFILQVTNIDDILLISWTTTGQNGGALATGTITKFPQAQRE